MTYLRITIFLIVLLFFSVFSFAQTTFFDFHLDLNTLNSKNVLIATMKYDLSNLEEPDFVIRPVVSEGRASIWNVKTNTWVDSNDLWDKMPTLSKEVQIKVEGIGESPVLLSFIIQSSRDSQLFFTPSQKIWSRNTYVKYLDKLNEKILVIAEESSQSSQIMDIPISPVNESIPGNVGVSPLIGIAIFVVLLVFLALKAFKVLK